MRKVLLALIALTALVLPGAALGHPLGNFTVNRYSEIVLSGDRIYVRYALDLAEIPTVQEGSTVRAPGFAAEVAERLVLEVEGRRVPLVPLQHAVRARPGAGRLDTLRFDAVFAAPEGAEGRELEYRDLNFERRIGWREIVAVASEGARVLSSDVPGSSPSDALRSYPGDLLSSPLDVTSARVAYEPAEGPGTAPTLVGSPAPPAHAIPVKWTTPPRVLTIRPPSAVTSPCHATRPRPSACGASMASRQPSCTTASGFRKQRSSRDAASAPRLHPPPYPRFSPTSITVAAGASS